MSTCPFILNHDLASCKGEGLNSETCLPHITKYVHAESPASAGRSAAEKTFCENRPIRRRTSSLLFVVLVKTKIMPAMLKSFLQDIRNSIHRGSVSGQESIFYLARKCHQVIPELLIYFLRKEQPSVSLALPPVGWQSTVEQPAQMTTVWA